MAIYFAKDFLVAVVYLSLFLAWRRKQIEGSSRRSWCRCFCWCGLECSRFLIPPHHISFFGVLGMKLFFYYVPLMLVGYALVGSEFEFRDFFRPDLIPILAITGLGIAQSIIGPTFSEPAVMQEISVN